MNIDGDNENNTEIMIRKTVPTPLVVDDEREDAH